jgi:hypothetical protein
MSTETLTNFGSLTGSGCSSFFEQATAVRARVKNKHLKFIVIIVGFGLQVIKFLPLP